MIRSKKFFAVGSIVSMAIMFVTLLLGFVEDDYHLGYFYSYWNSFEENAEEIYWPFFILSIAYISFGIVAVVLYNKRIKAINIINLILTSVVYIFAATVGVLSIAFQNIVFGISLLGAAVCIAFPFHLIVDIFALVAQKYKNTQPKPNYVRQEPVYAAPVAPAPTTSADNDAIEMLRQLKALYDSGVLTEEEYNAKRQQYVNKI